MIELKSYGLYSHQGPHLYLNEDLVEVDLVNNLFLIADGFGGMSVGDRASSIAVESIKKSFTRIAKDPESTLPFYYSHKFLLEGNALVNAFQTAHQVILKDNDTKMIDKKGGSSVLVGALSDNIMSIVSSGNCLSYLYRKGHLVPILIPDTISTLNRDPFVAFRQTIPLSGIGLFEDLFYQIKEVKLAIGDMLIFLTDGIYARLSDVEIKYIIERNMDREVEMIKNLVTLSNERGNLDNQSGIVLQF